MADAATFQSFEAELNRLVETFGRKLAAYIGANSLGTSSDAQKDNGDVGLATPAKLRCNSNSSPCS